MQNIFSFFAAKLNTIYPDLPFAQGITENSTLPDYIAYWFAFGIYVAGSLAVFSLAYSGIQLIMSTESPERAGNARERMKSSIIGVVILLGAFIILQTISPKLPTLPLELDLRPAMGVILKGGAGTIPAPLRVDDISKYSSYGTIEWPAKLATAEGVEIDNCDKNIYAYMIYWYDNTNFSSWNDWKELKCGESVGLGSTGSYVMVAETPGVYLYEDDHCGGIIGSNDLPQSAETTSIPDLAKSKYNKNIKSAGIINGPDADNGPFFGLMLFNGSGYYGSSIWDLSPKKITGDRLCEKITDRITYGGGSALIYQRAGSQDNPGPGVTLYTMRSQEAGIGALYCPPQHPNECIISGTDVMARRAQGSWWNKLENMKITYLSGGEGVPDELIDGCVNFNGPQNGFSSCFESMKIDGNFLVLLSRIQDDAYGAPVWKTCSGAVGAGPMGGASTVPSTCFQAFPSPEFKNGPPDINRTYIKATGSQYIKIIPLAKPFQ